MVHPLSMVSQSLCVLASGVSTVFVSFSMTDLSCSPLHNPDLVCLYVVLYPLGFFFSSCSVRTQATTSVKNMTDSCGTQSSVFTDTGPEDREETSERHRRETEQQRGKARTEASRSPKSTAASHQCAATQRTSCETVLLTSRSCRRK